MHARSATWLSIAALVPLAALAGGCGGDDEPVANPTAPELIPSDGGTEGTTSTAPPKVKTVEEGGGEGSVVEPPVEDTTEETTPTGPAPSRPPRVPDNPGNDTPPPKGSPAERFEQYCNQNPKACGG